MRQELTLLLDSFRLLQAKRLFWVALGISGLVGLVYASIGFTPTGMSMWFGLQSFDNPLIRAGTAEAEAFYLLLFTDLIVRFWLAWFAVALALISTSSIFPEFLREGAVEMLLSKPLGRLRLFVWKYLGSLLFVADHVLRGSPDEIRSRTTELRAAATGQRWILASGCDISPGVPQTNLAAFAEAAIP